jgi:hypothetical protein
VAPQLGQSAVAAVALASITILFDLLKGHVLKVREKKTDMAPDSATKVHIGHLADTRKVHKIFARTELRERQPPQAGEFRER